MEKIWVIVSFENMLVGVLVAPKKNIFLNLVIKNKIIKRPENLKKGHFYGPNAQKKIEKNEVYLVFPSQTSYPSSSSL